jgi:D-3-phosphoglycerate dehydrogenase
VVKWGIGVDNVDFDACKELGIPITNTPDMFGAEVADVAFGYIVGLARETFLIDREIRGGRWPKHRGISLAGRRVGLIGYGNIGKCTMRRLRAADMLVTGYDPAYSSDVSTEVPECKLWPEGLGECDFLVFTCSLNKANRHMLNEDTLKVCKTGVRVVNVARGPLIDEQALIAALQSGKVYSAALDVFEEEPLPVDSPLRDMPRCILGSHNASNTSDAVTRTNDRALAELFRFLDVD